MEDFYRTESPITQSQNKHVNDNVGLIYVLFINNPFCMIVVVYRSNLGK